MKKLVLKFAVVLGLSLAVLGATAATAAAESASSETEWCVAKHFPYN